MKIHTPFIIIFRGRGYFAPGRIDVFGDGEPDVGNRLKQRVASGPPHEKFLAGKNFPLGNLVPIGFFPVPLFDSLGFFTFFAVLIAMRRIAVVQRPEEPPGRIVARPPFSNVCRF